MKLLLSLFGWCRLALSSLGHCECSSSIEISQGKDGPACAAIAASSASSLVVRGFLLDVPNHTLLAHLASVVAEWERRASHLLK
jgi:hypothetical protein